MMDYLKQSPIIPVVLSAIVVIVILMQSITKKRFQIVKLLISFLLTFIAAVVLFFYAEIQDRRYKYRVFGAAHLHDDGHGVLQYLRFRRRAYGTYRPLDGAAFRAVLRAQRRGASARRV